MTKQQGYITGFCRIKAHELRKNNQQVWKGETQTSMASFLDAAYHFLKGDYPRFYKMDNLCKLGFLAAELLLRDRPIVTEYGTGSVGMVFCNASASLDTDLRYMETVKNIPSPAQFVYTLPNIVIGELSIRYGCRGENAFFVQEAFDADFLWFYVHDLIVRNRLQACLCGWVECLNEQYETVMYLVETRPGEISLPFETNYIQQIYRDS